MMIIIIVIYWNNPNGGRLFYYTARSVKPGLQSTSIISYDTRLIDRT